MLDLSSVISFVRPGAIFALVGGNLSGLMWYGPGQPPTQEEIDAAWDAAETAAAWDEIRVERDLLLAGSDWTQVADAPVNSAAWATYRQALRDIPQDFDSPDDVVWPAAP